MKKALLVCLMVFASLYLYGQEEVLSYAEAIEMALQKNVMLNQQQNELNIYEAEKKQSIFGYTPSLNASLSAQQFDGRGFDQTKGEIVDQRTSSISGGISANLLIFDGFGRLNSLKATNHSLNAWQDNLARTEQDVIIEVTQQYLQSLLDKELLNIARENLKNQKMLLQQIEGFYELGTRPVVDKINQEAQVQRQEVLVIRAKNNYENDLANLGSVIMIDPTKSFTLKVPDWDMDQIISNSLSLSDLYQGAKENRADLKGIQENVLAANYNVKAVNSRFLPSISFFYNYGSNYTSAIQSYTDQETGETIDADFEYQFFTLNPRSFFGASLQIPLLSRFANKAGQIRAKVAYENAQLESKRLERNIYNEVQQAYNDFQAARENYFASQAQVMAAEKSLELEKESYELGISDLVEVSTANQAYIEAASNLAQAKYTLLFQEIFLNYSLGTLEADMIVND